MADPAEDIPADGPLGQGDGDFEFRALGPGVPGAAGVGAMVELADQLHRAFEGVDAAVSVVADVHPAATGRAITVEDIEFPEGEIGIFGPSIRHPGDPDAVLKHSHVGAQQDFTLGVQELLALWRTIDF